MLEGQLEAEMKKAFGDMERTVERTGLGLHDHLDHMEGGQLSKVMTAILDMTERVRKMELAIGRCQSEITQLDVDIADLQTRVEMATRGR
jgi:hypothetical protein